jgi:hypothetical protein
MVLRGWLARDSGEERTMEKKALALVDEGLSLAPSEEIPFEIGGAVGVTQDGWIRFVSGLPPDTKDEHGRLIPTDIYRLYSARAYFYRSAPYEAEIKKYHGTKFVRRVRHKGEEWSKPEEFKTLGKAKGIHRIPSRDGKELQRKLVEEQRKQYAKSVDVDFAEYTRRYRVAVKRQRMWKDDERSPKAQKLLREAKLDFESVYRQEDRLREEYERASAKLGADANRRREALFAEHGIGHGEGWPLDKVKAWHKRVKDFVGFFGTVPWERHDYRARIFPEAEAAVQEFPELWTSGDSTAHEGSEKEKRT